MGPRTVVLLRSPDANVPVAENERWIDFVFGDRVVTFFGPTRDGHRDLLSVPWDRIVSIDTTDGIVPPAAPAAPE